MTQYKLKHRSPTQSNRKNPSHMLKAEAANVRHARATRALSEGKKAGEAEALDSCMEAPSTEEYSAAEISI